MPDTTTIPLGSYVKVRSYVPFIMENKADNVSPPMNGSSNYNKQLEEQHSRLTPAKSFLYGAAENALPTAAGVGATGLAMTALAGVAAPYIVIPAGIAAGLGAAMGTKKAQDVVIENYAPKIYSKLEKAREENPNAYLMGGVAAGLPVFSVGGSIRNLGAAASGLGRLATLKPITANQIRALGEIGTAAGIGAGIEAANQYLSDGEPDASAIVKAAIANSVLNAPRSYVNKLFPVYGKETPIEKRIFAKEEGPVKPQEATQLNLPLDNGEKNYEFEFVKDMPASKPAKPETPEPVPETPVKDPNQLEIPFDKPELLKEPVYSKEDLFRLSDAVDEIPYYSSRKAHELYNLSDNIIDSIDYYVARTKNPEEIKRFQAGKNKLQQFKTQYEEVVTNPKFVSDKPALKMDTVNKVLKLMGEIEPGNDPSSASLASVIPEIKKSLAREEEAIKQLSMSAKTKRDLDYFDRYSKYLDLKKKQVESFEKAYLKAIEGQEPIVYPKENLLEEYQGKELLWHTLQGKLEVTDEGKVILRTNRGPIELPYTKTTPKAETELLTEEEYLNAVPEQETIKVDVQKPSQMGANLDKTHGRPIQPTRKSEVQPEVKKDKEYKQLEFKAFKRLKLEKPNRDHAQDILDFYANRPFEPYKPDSTIFSFLTKSVLSSLASKGPQAGILAEGFLRFRNTQLWLRGQWTSKAQEALDMLYDNPVQRLQGDSPSSRRVYESLLQDWRTGDVNNSNLTEREIKAKAKIREVIEEVADAYIEDGPYVKDIKGSRVREKLPNYFPEVPSKEIFEKLRNNDEDFAQLRQDYINHVISRGGTESKAKSLFDALVGLPGYHQGFDLSFKGSREAHEYGFPVSWIEKNLSKALYYYLERSSTDLAFYREIEKSPVLRGLLQIVGDGRDYKKPYPKYIVNPDGTVEELFPLNNAAEVKIILRQITNNYPVQDAFVDAANRLVKSMMMQTKTGLRDFLMTPFIAMEIIKPSELPLIVKAYENLNEGIAGAKRTGIIRNMTSSWEDFKTSYRTATADNIATTINKITGRETFEEWSRGYAFSLGRLIAESRYLAGDKSFMQKYGPPKNKKISLDDSLDWAAARFVEDIQGSYDWTRLPVWTLEGKLSPLFSLAKWSVERLNRFDRNVLVEARKGNLRPLLLATLGAFIGGTAVDELSNALEQKKPEHLSFEEWLVLGDDNLYRWAAIAAASGYAGILGDMTKTLQDVYYNADAKSFTFPLIQSTAQAIARLGQASEAIQEGEVPGEVFPLLITTLLADNIQNARFIINQFTKDVERRGAFRDLRVYKRIYEKEVPGQVYDINPFIGSTVREFKRLSYRDADKLSEIVPKVLDWAVQDPQKRLPSLRRNVYKTVPNPEENPFSFNDYLEFLKLTQGEEEANKRIQDYFMQKQFNKYKQELIPVYNAL